MDTYVFILGKLLPPHPTIKSLQGTDFMHHSPFKFIEQMVTIRSCINSLDKTHTYCS